MFGRWVGSALATVVAVVTTAAPGARTVFAAHGASSPPGATLVTGAVARLDLGIVAVGDEPHCEFRIVNDGGVPLTLRPTTVPSGLTITALDDTIAPGTSGRVELMLDGFAVAGPTTLETVLATGDPGRPEMRLTVVADVRPFVVADPGFARYLFVRGAREGTIAQTLWARDGATFHVTHVSSPAPSLRVTAREARASERVAEATGRQWRVESTLASHAPVGPLAGFIELTLDHPRQRRLRIPVSGFVRPMFAVTPPAGDLGMIQRGAAVHGRFVMKNFADERVAIERVSTDVSGVTAAVTTVDPGHAFTIALAVAADAPLGVFDGHLRIRTSSPKEREVAVPITGTIGTADVAATSRADPAP